MLACVHVFGVLVLVSAVGAVSIPLGVSAVGAVSIPLGLSAVRCTKMPPLFRRGRGGAGCCWLTSPPAFHLVSLKVGRLAFAFVFGVFSPIYWGCENFGKLGLSLFVADASSAVRLLRLENCLCSFVQFHGFRFHVGALSGVACPRC